MDHTELKDTQAIEKFMLAFEQNIRTRPVSDDKHSVESPDDTIPEAEIKLRAELVTEELFELLAAMGFRIEVSNEDLPVGRVQNYSLTRHADSSEGKVYDSLETLDALGDLIYVIKGTGLALGVNIDAAVLDAIHPSNMSKLDDNGKPLKREDGKGMKSKNYWTPTEKLKNILQKGR